MSNTKKYPLGNHSKFCIKSLNSCHFVFFPFPFLHMVPNSDIGFMCLRIHKRENQVVEIEESTLSRGGDSFSEGGCSYQRFNKNYLTLFVIRQSSSSSSSSSSISSSSNDDLNKISDRDNPSSSSLDPALHSNPSASSAPSFSSVNIKYLASLISLVISQRMMSVNFWWSLNVLWAKIILSLLIHFTSLVLVTRRTCIERRNRVE